MKNNEFVDYLNNYLFADRLMPICEQFVPIRGTNKHYWIGNFGTVMSHKKYGKPEKITAKLDKDGYYRVGLFIDGKKISKFVHRLVAQHFVPNPDPNNFDVVNHIDGNRTNNCYLNLQWCTWGYNMHHKVMIGNAPVGENHTNAKLTNEQALEIYNLNQTGQYTYKELSTLYNVSPSIVRNLCTGRTYNAITNHLNKISIIKLDGTSKIDQRERAKIKEMIDNE